MTFSPGTILSHRKAHRLLVLLALIGLLALCASWASAAPAMQSASEGETIFKQKCLVCHTIGSGKAVGPDLDGVVGRRDRAWLERWILEPDKMLAAKDPIAMQLLAENNNVPMQNMGLTPSQVTSVIAYLESAQGTVVTLATANLPKGDASVGKALFSGAERLQNGGPACMACHSVAGLGALGGGALGPDLTPAFNIYGAAGLANFLETVPTVTMNAVWTRQPLTTDEQANLYAFLEEASVSARPPAAFWQLTALAVGGAIVLTALAHFYWRKRLTGVRKPLVARARISA